MTVHCDVMVVDDDGAVREALADLLTSEGLSVRTAESGMACLRALETCRPAIILLDVQMPQMTGPEVRETLRASRAWASIPVVLMSAGLVGNSDDTVRKPFLDLEPLLRRIRGALEHEPRAAIA